VKHEFPRRHIGPNTADQQLMLEKIGYSSLASFIDAVVPPSIRGKTPLQLDETLSEHQTLRKLKAISKKNKVFRSCIGLGYYNCYMPSVIQRNILENSAWYTAYTPYQPEISQGRLEALVNYQTMVTDLTGLDIANASMLDEATAAAEAMTLCHRMAKNKSNVFFVDHDCLPQTIDVIRTRAEPLGIQVVVGNPADAVKTDCFVVLLQYPGASGAVQDYTTLVKQCHERNMLVVMAADILSLLLLKSPGAMGADVAIGSTQRFGIPLGFGGPHAAYMAVRDEYRRSLPGRLVGVSQDSQGDVAYRLSLQTREQHIRREKATSNICTAQVLLAVLAGMYAVYHGPQGLKQIALRTHALAARLAQELKRLGYRLQHENFFDTLTIVTGAQTHALHQRARALEYNLREIDDAHIGISLDETATEIAVQQLLAIFNLDNKPLALVASELKNPDSPIHGIAIPHNLQRTEAVLAHPVFNRYHSETEMLRYIRSLSDKDLALDRAMIPLGSCTMKLNAASEMLPISWAEFAFVHPFAPREQVQGYLQLVSELEQMLCACTGYDAASLQPNAGSQGEYAGLLAIRAYHHSRGDAQRKVCLIPSSAHGTNPASAQMCGMQVVVVKCDEHGNVDLQDLTAKAELHRDTLAALMITYPSTHGVFEQEVEQVCKVVHDHGGQVYIDGANLNAMVGLCEPGKFGGDVSHLNLHKTFAIPHGGGGPGVGPTMVKAHLAPFLPRDGLHRDRQPVRDGAPVSAAPFGSAGVLPIPWMYISMMGAEGLTRATEVAILNANYMAHQLKDDFTILYTGMNGRVAHECIVDLRPLKESTGITEEDVCKRLIDYGFHAPTMSFPVPGTLMIEPTESESKSEIDRFIGAMKQIRREIDDVVGGRSDKLDNPLKNAPHTALMVSADLWTHAYPRAQAAYPVASLKQQKYWSPVGRVDNVYGDRHLFCSCVPVEQSGS
jgi:glycine dehydrogenase